MLPALQTELLTHSRELVQRAKELRVQNRLILADVRSRHAERAVWGDLIGLVRTSPESLVAACLLCGRLRTPDGVWRKATRVISKELNRRQQLSHTYCDDCVLERQLG